MAAGVGLGGGGGEGRGGGGGEDLFDPPTPSPTPSTLPRPLLRRLTLAPSLKRGRWQEVQLAPLSVTANGEEELPGNMAAAAAPGRAAVFAGPFILLE